MRSVPSSSTSAGPGADLSRLTGVYLDGLRLIRDSGPPGMDIAAGEYGYAPWCFRGMLDAGAVDVLQADATRCQGISGFLRADALCEAHSMPLSAHRHRPYMPMWVAPVSASTTSAWRRWHSMARSRRSAECSGRISAAGVWVDVERG